MRTLWIAGTFHPQPGGIPVYVDRLTDALSADCEVALVTEAQHKPPSNPRITHIPVAGICRPANAAEWERAAAEIADAAGWFEPDVVHFASACEAVYQPALAGVGPAVATVHGNDLTAPWQTTPGRNTTAAIVDGLNRCQHVFAVSGHTQGLAAQRNVQTSVSVVTAGCDLKVFRPLPGTAPETRMRYGLPVDEPIVLTVGRLAPRKGHLELLAALDALPRRTHWLVVGVGPMRKALEQAIEERGMRERVSLIDKVSKHELALLYNAADVFVLAPLTLQRGDFVDSEGFGLVYLEASACGKPVIASDGAGCREAVIDGCTGFLVPPGDVQELAGTLARLLSNPRLAESVGRAGCTFVHASGGWQRLARETYEVYRSVAELRLPPPTPSPILSPL